MSVWGELRRRSVFRVGAAYAVAAWLLVQVAAIVLPAFEFAPWVFRALLVVVAVGFVVAVVLAWLYELTPAGIKRDDEVSAADRRRLPLARRLDFAIIVLLALALTVLLLRDSMQPATAESSSLAVLAFSNRSPDPADAYFADGLADELLSTLSRVRELRVASRTSSFYFKDKDADVATISEVLGVERILSGSVQRDGDSIRVTVALDDTASGELIWSESYDRNVESLLDIQREIAEAVSAAIVPVLSPESRALVSSRPTDDARAYDFYLRGREYLRLPPEPSTLASAAELFDRAVALDARFGEAYAGLCEVGLGRYELERTPASFESGEAACQRAVALGNTSWDVRLALGELYLTAGRPGEARVEIESGLSQQPNAVDLILALAQTYAQEGDFAIAEETLLRAEASASGYWRVHNELGHIYLDSGRHDEAVERYRRVIELTPDSGIGYDNLGNTLQAMARFDEAEEVLNQSPLPSRWTYENRGLVYYYQREFARSVEDHRRALELAPEYHAEWGRLGDAYRFLAGREREAQEAYLRAIEFAENERRVNPDDLEVMTRLSNYYVHAGQPAEAESLVRQFVEREPDFRRNSVGYYFAGIARLHLGDVDGAFELLRRTIAAGWPRSYVLADPDVAALGEEAEERL